jgi:hypothetical protein
LLFTSADGAKLGLTRAPRSPRAIARAAAPAAGGVNVVPMAIGDGNNAMPRVRRATGPLSWSTPISSGTPASACSCYA